MRYLVAIDFNMKGGSLERFEIVYRKDAERRRSLGCTGGRVFRDITDPDSVFHTLEFQTKEGAIAFVTAEETDRAFLWASSSASPKARIYEEVLVTDY